MGFGVLYLTRDADELQPKLVLALCHIKVCYLGFKVYNFAFEWVWGSGHGVYVVWFRV